ncbi:hypothetical protein AMAG_16975 [Allomyces macrogynus ATCC 38327]|uniref:Protein PNS1 n=1 Tax=Allomyces macrogynus (strain ATCC 38327) TaxID=578462 RepID=A0A0L0TDX7_ALLM3|nr:hypothetical protein AMAG_16975 [Allomyces macrogynus ATCC 38327]|eukprot:KNE72875.1 hypothetical protein AMAG_16975 [Allomyces macrogynus ATCC 38327]
MPPKSAHKKVVEPHKMKQVVTVQMSEEEKEEEEEEEVEVAKTVAVVPEGFPLEYHREPGPKATTRKCNDAVFFILFVLTWVGMVVIAIVAFQKGDFNRLKYGTDSWGNLCGAYNPPVGQVPAFDMTNRTYLHYLNGHATGNVISRCVASCPKKNDVVCFYNTTVASTPAGVATQIAQGNCFPVLFNTTDMLYRCIPLEAVQTLVQVQYPTLQPNSTMVKIANFVLSDLNGRTIAAKMTQSLAYSWPIVLGMAFLALGLSFAWLMMIMLIAGGCVWLTVIMANMCLAGIVAMLWYNWAMIETNGKQILVGWSKIDSLLMNWQTLLTLSIVASVVFLLLFVVTIAARKRIQLAVIIIQETAQAIKTMPLIVIFPIAKYFLIAGLFAFFVVVYALLATSGTVIAQTFSTSISLSIANQDWTKMLTPDTVLPFLQIYIVFGFFWTWNFFLGVWQTTIAGAIAGWYWTRDKSALARSPLRTAFARCFRYHLGSIAFGSMLIALVQVVRWILVELQRRLRASKANAVTQQILACTQCCCIFVEKFLAFLNKNAYIEIAVYGYSFCDGAKMAFQLLVRNAFRLVVIDRVSGFLFLLGKLIIVSGTCMIALALLQTFEAGIADYYAIPLIFVFVISWVVASFFMSVMDMAVDTIFLCFCEDCERNDGSKERPYYMTPTLREFTDRHKGEKPDIAT